MLNPESVAHSAVEMPSANFDASVAPSAMVPKISMSPTTVPTSPSNGATPVMISSTTRPRSIWLTSCRARDCSASTLSGLAHSRCSTAVVVNRASGVSLWCSANRNTVLTSARVWQWSRLSTNGCGRMILRRSAQPLSMINVKLITEVRPNKTRIRVCTAKLTGTAFRGARDSIGKPTRRQAETMHHASNH